MAILLDTDAEADAWRTALAGLDPTLEIRSWPEVGDPREIEFALVWRPRTPDFAAFPLLRGIFNLGAGVERLLKRRDLPESVPIIRLVDPVGLTGPMTEYVLWQVLRLHRRGPELEAMQREKRWDELTYPLARDRRVGILGQGVLGSDAAARLIALDFDVAGWSRRPKPLPGGRNFAGEAELPAFLARSEILVVLLPLTADTAGLHDARRFALLPRGAGIVNAARGGIIVDADLLAALDSGQIGHATLDVFHEEPLPAGHPFWTHPQVTVTPHVASLTHAETAAPIVLAGIAALRAGRQPADTVDRKTGY
jgi:glyoxylate/hydroxypyruvate reductase A